MCNIRVLYYSNIRVLYSCNIRVYTCASIPCPFPCTSNICSWAHRRDAIAPPPCIKEHGADIGRIGNRTSEESESGHRKRRRAAIGEIGEQSSALAESGHRLNRRAAISRSEERPSVGAEKGHWQKRRGKGKGLRRKQFAAAQPCVSMGRTPARDACAAPGERAPLIGWVRWRTCKCKPSRSTHTSAAGPGRSWRCPARAWLRPG